MDYYPGWDILTADSIREESLVYSELMKLDEKYRIPIVLRDIEGYSVKEIGKMLHLTETNVRNRLSRGKAMLRTHLEGEV
jgi:RNA polymerase sigma-70 factor (ECF subfamily)